MANPRVFISSTCYDLSEVRDSLVDFVSSFGFEAILSDRGDVFYHPDIHTHESCLNEVANCQLFILIIGGRFGGSYVSDTSRSIVNAEYSAARGQKIPVFTFVKRNVHSDHLVYQKNKTNSNVKSIVFPSIDNNLHAEKIFSFIDEVRLAPVNNGFFPFDFARDIADVLRKQWAGMFYDFLEQRQTSRQLATATTLLKNISIAGEKVEELVKGLYRHVDTVGAEKKIESVEKRAVARSFFEEAFNQGLRENLEVIDTRLTDLYGALLNAPMNGSWYEYLATALGATVEEMEFPGDDNVEKTYLALDWGGFGIIVDCPADPNEKVSIKARRQAERFEVVKSMAKAELGQVIRELDLGLKAPNSN